MKKSLTLTLALVVLATFSNTSNAARNLGSGIPVLPSGSALTVQVMGGSVACPPPAPAVINTSPWMPAGQKINCNATGGLDCSEANISAGTIVRLSTAPYHPSGSWSITGGLVTPTPGTCGYSAPNVGHTDCEFTMPPNNLNVRVELPCPPPQATSCMNDIANGVLTIPTPAISNITGTSANLSGTVTVMPIPVGCTYQAKLVWGPPNWTPATGPNATGSAPPSTITLSGTASPLSPGSAYGARIEVTKQCLGLAPTVCNGPTKPFETPKREECDLEVKKSLAHMIQHPPFQTGQQVSFEIYVTNRGNGVCSAPVSVIENFSGGLSYVSGGTAGWGCPSAPQNSPVTCTYNQPIAPNQTSMFLVAFDVTGPPPNQAGNCASVGNSNDTNFSNNRACIEVPIEAKPCKDVTINLSTGQNTNWSVSPGTVGILTYPVVSWITGGGASWIQPANFPTPQTFNGTSYQYSVPFTLPPISQFSSISLSGQYAADNSATVKLNNGPTLPGNFCSGPNCFSSWHSFAITSGFVNNQNTLDVTVGNQSGSWTGLIVNATLSATCK